MDILGFMFWLQVWGIIAIGGVLILFVIYWFLPDKPVTNQEWQEWQSSQECQKFKAQLAIEGAGSWWHRLRLRLQRPHSYTDG